MSSNGPNQQSMPAILGSSISSSVASILRTFGIGTDVPFPLGKPDSSLITYTPHSKAEQQPVSFNPWTKSEILSIYKDLCRRIPAELVSEIIEDAGFWEARSCFCESGGTNVEWDVGRCPRFVTNTSVPVLYSNEIDGSLQNPLRRIIVRTISKDQGWSSYPADWGTHNNSWTWFDITLERRDSENEGKEWKEVVRRKLWSNVHASREMITHVMSLERGEEIVDKAMKGDRICVWACAKFPGWRCEIERVDIWVFNAVH
jgi:hypothetical protein